MLYISKFDGRMVSGSNRLKEVIIHSVLTHPCYNCTFIYHNHPYFAVLFLIILFFAYLCIFSHVEIILD